MADKYKATAETISSHDERLRIAKERESAKMRHLQGVAASVMEDAMNVWLEIWEACRDQRSCEEIILGDENEPRNTPPHGGWPELCEKLDLLGHYIDYTKRLCDGSIENTEKNESEG